MMGCYATHGVGWGGVGWGVIARVGFGFRVSGFGCRVSIGPGEGKSSESVSGFGFRVSQFETNFNSRFWVSGFGFRWSKPTLQTPLRIISKTKRWVGLLEDSHNKVLGHQHHITTYFFQLNSFFPIFNHLFGFI